jgi:hypothetical protein
MYVVLAGRPSTGVEVFGPFQTEEEATSYAERYEDYQDENMCHVIAEMVVVSEPLSSDDLGPE